MRGPGAVLPAALALSALVSCGEPAGDPDAAPMADAGSPDAGVCGDGVAQPGEQCDDGNDDSGDVCAADCTVNGDTHDVTLRWWFNRDDSLGFEGDACFDVGAEQVELELELEAQPSVRYLRREECGFRQATFLGIPVGSYQVRLRVLDADDPSVTVGEVRRPLVIAPPIDLLDLRVDPDDWNESFTGSFFFRIRWGEGVSDCADATPPVAQHVLLLTQGGVPVAATTDGGDALDGSASGACRSLEEPLPQLVEQLPFGAARLTVSGLDGGGAEVYRGVFDTFVGAGLSNPELVFDVPATPAE